MEKTSKEMIVYLLDEKGWKQREIAKAVSMTQANISAHSKKDMKMAKLSHDKLVRIYLKEGGK